MSSGLPVNLILALEEESIFVGDIPCLQLVALCGALDLELDPFITTVQDEHLQRRAASLRGAG